MQRPRMAGAMIALDAVATDVAVLSLAASADLASTHHALQSCRACYEANPLMSEPELSIALKAATIAGTAAVCSKLRKNGRGRAAKVLRWTVTAVWLGVAAHNMRAPR